MEQNFLPENSILIRASKPRGKCNVTHVPITLYSYEPITLHNYVPITLNNYVPITLHNYVPITIHNYVLTHYLLRIHYFAIASYSTVKYSNEILPLPS